MGVKCWVLGVALISLTSLPPQPQVSKSPKSQNPTPNSLTIAAVGDIMLARGTGRQMARNGRDYPFTGSRTILRAADIAIGNLECVLTQQDFTVNQQFLFRADPALASNLKTAGFTILNLANNHSMDCGPEGLRDTIESLTKAGIRYCGVEDTPGTQQPAIIVKSGLRIAFLGFCDFKPPGPEVSPCVAYATTDSLRRGIEAARAKANAVVVSFHWGEEYSDKPTPRQIELAKLAADCGANVILGHHPHVLQRTDLLPTRTRPSSPLQSESPNHPLTHSPPHPLTRSPALVAYSLGGFIWDGHSPREKKSAILSCVFDRAGLLAADWIPMQIVSCSPKPSRDSVIRLFHR